MQELASRLLLLWGWRRALTALIAGAVSVLAFAPFDFFPVLFLTFPILIWLIDGVGLPEREERFGNSGYVSGFAAAFIIGWSFGFGFFVAGLYWIGTAFLVEAERFALLLPLAVIALPAGLAIFHGLAVMVAWFFWSQGVMRLFAFAAALAGAEWVRGHILTGFPWNLIGYSLTGYLPTMQGAAYIGIYGMTLLALVIFVSPATLGAPDLLPGRRASNRDRFGMPLLGLFLLAALTLNGLQRIAGNTQVGMLPDIVLRIVQPNISQAEKWRIENRSRIFADLVNLSDRATSPGISGISDVTHVIWPETAPPFLLEETPEALAAIAAMLPDGTHLVTGSVRRDLEQGGAGQLFNSLFVLGSGAEITTRYDKLRLVPFGEFLPFQDFLERLGIEQLTRIRGGFTPGADTALLAIPGLPTTLAMICYEAIFGGEIIDPENRPGFLLNVTNDAWFGNTIGPYQHFRQSQLRAVEEGLPLVRAANTGISAIVDPYGRVLDTLPLGSVGVIDTGLPGPLPPTIYGLYGDWIFFGLLLLAGLSGFVGRLLDSKRR